MRPLCTNFLDSARFCTIAFLPMSTANEHVEILKTEVLSDNWYVLRKVTFRLRKRDGSWKVQGREAYTRGNGDTILLYDSALRRVVLSRQFRLPTFVNGN